MPLEILLASLLLIAAVAATIRSWRLARWVPVDAEVVHTELVGPFGLSPTRFARQLELQRRGQGAMETEIVYYAELVYLVNGVPHIAGLTFDGPPDQKVCLRFNPSDPFDYTTSHPNYVAAIVLACLGLALLLSTLW